LAPTPTINTQHLQKQVEALQAGLLNLKDALQRKIGKKGLRAAMKVVNDAIKAEIPGPWKDIKRLIGLRLLKRAVGDQIAGKVGVGVGKKQKGRKPKDRTGKAGVGVAPENVHWFILGTIERYAGLRNNRERKTGKFTGHRPTGKKVAFRGKMPSQVPGIVQRGFEASYVAALKRLIEVVREEMEKERAKIRAAIKAALGAGGG